jgi:hypothetical protein
MPGLCVRPIFVALAFYCLVFLFAQSAALATMRPALRKECGTLRMRMIAGRALDADDLSGE